MTEAISPEDDPLQQAEEQIADLEIALVNRSITSAAVGILMERYGLSYDTAFKVLVRASNHRNERLFNLAVELMDTGQIDGLSL